MADPNHHAPTNRRKTCVCYCRTSTTRQKESETITAQLSRCRSLVEHHELELLPYDQDGWILDDGVTGTLLEGRRFAQLLDDLERSVVKPDYIVLFSLSRISRVDKVSKSMEKLKRSHADAARIQAILIGTGVKVIDEDGVTDPASITFQVKSMVANEEFRLIRERTMAGKARRFGEGSVPKGGRPPYGYTHAFANGVDRKGGLTFDVHPQDGENLRRMLDWFCEGGLAHAARMATEAEIPTPMAATNNRKNRSGSWTPTRWSPVSVQHIVRNIRAYLGETTYIFDGKPYVVTYPPLIDLETFARVEHRRKEKAVKRRASFLSTGFVDCECGAHVHARNSRGRHFARCANGCGGVPQVYFEAQLFATMAIRLAAIAGADPAETEDGTDRRLEALQEEIATVGNSIRLTLDAFLSGLDRKIFEERNSILNDRKAGLCAEVSQLQAERERATRRQSDERNLAERANSILADLQGEGAQVLERKRRALADLLQGERAVAVWVDPPGSVALTVGFRFPPFRNLPAMSLVPGGPIVWKSPPSVKRGSEGGDLPC